MPCTCEKKDYLKSYQGLAEEVQQANPQLTSLEIKKEAAIVFRRWYRENQAYEKPFKEYAGPEFTVTPDGQIYYPQYGTTLEQLHQNQLKRTPDKYSATEHATSRSIQAAFREGATVVVTSYARNGKDNRDLLVMEIDPVTKKGRTRIVNTALNGEYHTFSGIREIAKKRFNNLTEIAHQENIFLLTDKSISRQKIKQSLRVVEQRQMNRLPGNLPMENLTNLGVRVYGDVRETVLTTWEFFLRKKTEAGIVKLNTDLPVKKELITKPEKIVAKTPSIKQIEKVTVVSREFVSFKKQRPPRKEIRLREKIKKIIKEKQLKPRQTETRKQVRKEQHKLRLTKSERKLIFVWAMLRKIRSWGNKLERLIAPAKKLNKEKKKTIRLEKSERLIEFITVYCVWYLLRFRSTEKPIAAKRYLEIKKTANSETPPVFLLLAIIRYLAQIKEQGMLQTPTLPAARSARRKRKKIVFSLVANRFNRV